MTEIAVVDRHPVTRRGIEQVLSAIPDMSVVAVAGSLEGLAAVGWSQDWDTRVDLLVSDRAVPGLRTRVLVVSASDEAADVVEAITAGAVGYVSKDADDEEIRLAVEVVARGGFYLSGGLADRLRVALGRDRPQPDVPLAPREVETLRWISHGLTHRQIARRMGLTEATINTYVKRIRAKLNAGNKAELTRYALAMGDRWSRPARPELPAPARAQIQSRPSHIREYQSS